MRLNSQINAKAIDFMQRQAEAGKPFFAYIPYTQPHLPTIPHPDFDGRTGKGHYADVIEEILRESPPAEGR